MIFAALNVAFTKGTGDPEIDRLLNTSTVFQDPGTMHVLVVIGAALLMGLLMFLIVYLAKKRSNARRASRSSRSSASASSASQRTNAYGLEEHSSSGFKLFGKKRKRRHHRPRNPTLAETGGLPPARDDTPAKPSV